MHKVFLKGSFSIVMFPFMFIFTNSHLKSFGRILHHTWVEFHRRNVYWTGECSVSRGHILWCPVITMQIELWVCEHICIHTKLWNTVSYWTRNNLLLEVVSKPSFINCFYSCCTFEAWQENCLKFETSSLDYTRNSRPFWASESDYLEKPK